MQQTRNNFAASMSRVSQAEFSCQLPRGGSPGRVEVFWWEARTSVVVDRRSSDGVGVKGGERASVWPGLVGRYFPPSSRVVTIGTSCIARFVNFGN